MQSELCNYVTTSSRNVQYWQYWRYWEFILLYSLYSTSFSAPWSTSTAKGHPPVPIYQWPHQAQVKPEKFYGDRTGSNSNAKCPSWKLLAIWSRPPANIIWIRHKNAMLLHNDHNVPNAITSFLFQLARVARVILLHYIRVCSM